MHLSVQMFDSGLLNMLSPGVRRRLTNTFLFGYLVKLKSSSDNALSSIMVLGRHPVAHRIETHSPWCRNIGASTLTFEAIDGGNSSERHGELSEESLWTLEGWTEESSGWWTECGVSMMKVMGHGWGPCALSLVNRMSCDCQKRAKT
jgi:hypothetical protein